jgi:hypothetical protein
MGGPVDRAARLDRRRRRQHYRRRRRDLLQDVLTAIVLMILALSLTPGLGMIAIFEAAVGLTLVVSVVVKRRLRKRPPAARRTARRASST